MVIPAAWTHGASLPVPGEICLARFPYVESPDAPAPKLHPVLVLALNRSLGPLTLYVAYGSSQRLADARPWDLVLSLDEAAEVGIDKATRFHLDRRAWLPYDDTWFERPIGYQTPRIGRLPNGARARLTVCRVTWELAHQSSLIPGKDPVAPLATPTDACKAEDTSGITSAGE
jgi:hypothetical protein